MSQNSRNSFGVITAGLVFAFLAGCTSSGTAVPLTGTTPSAESARSTTPQLQTVTSEGESTPPVSSTTEDGTTESTVEPSATSTTETSSTSSNPWPGTFTAEQAADAQAAVDALMGYSALTDAAFADPAKDWTEEIKKWAADPVRTQFVNAIQGTAELGQYGTGSVVVVPTVTSVEGAVATIAACFDSTNVEFFNKDGVSIKAPDAPGSYFRHPAQIEVARYASGAWLVTTISDDYSTSC